MIVVLAGPTRRRRARVARRARPGGFAPRASRRDQAESVERFGPEPERQGDAGSSPHRSASCAGWSLRTGRTVPASSRARAAHVTFTLTGRDAAGHESTATGDSLRCAGRTAPAPRRERRLRRPVSGRPERGERLKEPASGASRLQRSPVTLPRGLVPGALHHPPLHLLDPAPNLLGPRHAGLEARRFLRQRPAQQLDEALPAPRRGWRPGCARTGPRRAARRPSRSASRAAP